MEEVTEVTAAAAMAAAGVEGFSATGLAGAFLRQARWAHTTWLLFWQRHSLQFSIQTAPVSQRNWTGAAEKKRSKVRVYSEL